jgi:hypothetical protein
MKLDSVGIGAAEIPQGFGDLFKSKESTALGCIV